MKKILLVSEPSIITKSILAFCKDAGDEVTHTTNGVEAISMLLNSDYDFLITSLFNEGLDGVQLITTIKSSYTHNSMIPMAVLTSDENIGSLFPEKVKPDYTILKNENTMDEFAKVYGELKDQSAKEITNVLYIDDDKFVQKMITLWFSKLDDYKLDMCGYIQGISNFENNEYDIIISDNLLTDGDFKDVAKKLMSSPLKDVPILVYTGSVDKIDVVGTKQLAKVIDVLPKPFDLKYFFKVVESIKNPI